MARVMDFQHCLWKTILNYTELPEDIYGGKGRGEKEAIVTFTQDVPL